MTYAKAPPACRARGHRKADRRSLSAPHSRKRLIMTVEPHAARILDRDKIGEITTRVLADMVQRDMETLGEDVRLFLDLSLTSINALELIMMLEDELGVELRTDALSWSHLETLGSLTSYVADQAGV